MANKEELTTLYRSTRCVMVGDSNIYVGDVLKVIEGWLYIITHRSKKTYRFQLEEGKEFPYGDWKKMLKEFTIKSDEAYPYKEWAGAMG